MKIKQKITYDKNHKPIKEIEYLDGEIILTKKFDEFGNVCELTYSNSEWFKWTYDKDGRVLYVEDNTGYWCLSRYSKSGVLMFKSGNYGVIYDWTSNKK